MILEAKNISKVYVTAGESLEVLKSASVGIKTGEVVAIVGPSGAGKSTLMHILGGLDNPTKGTVFLQGNDVYKLKDAARAKVRNEHFGFIFQFYHLLPEFTALENVVLPALIKEDAVSTKKFEPKAQALLERVGLGARLKHKSNQLSGGEQQRVAIARALMNDPKIIFCDEPTGNLDSENGRMILELLLKLNKENKQTVVIVTHDESIAKAAHRIIQIRDGRIIKT